MSAGEKTQRPRHGAQPQGYVCIHTVDALNDKTPRGFIWARDDEGEINAYFDACEDLLKAHGGDWNEASEKAADMHAICEACAAEAAQLNGESVL